MASVRGAALAVCFIGGVCWVGLAGSTPPLQWGCHELRRLTILARRALGDLFTKPYG